MKKYITPPFLGFVATATLLTVAARFCISASINHDAVQFAIVSSFAYAILMFTAGWWFGSKDVKYLPIYDVGLRFNLTTCIIYLAISYLWFGLGFNSSMEKVSDIQNILIIIWEFAVVVHFVIFLTLRHRRSINGLDKKDLF